MMARPLHDLTKKDTPWQWNKEQQEAFDSIKHQFCTEPILKVYDPELQYIHESKWMPQDLLQEESCLRSMTMVFGTPLHIALS